MFHGMLSRYKQSIVQITKEIIPAPFHCMPMWHKSYHSTESQFNFSHHLVPYLKHTHTYTHTHEHTHTHACTHTHTQTHTQTSINTNTHIHTHIHTYTQA